MGKSGEVVRLAVLIIGGAFVLQAPIFFAILKLSDFGKCNDKLSRARETLVFGSFNNTAMKPEMESAPGQSNCPRLPSQATAHPGGKKSQKDSSRRSSFKSLGVASHPFVLFSAYRGSLDTFYVLGITSVVVRQYEDDKPVYRCEWHPNNGTQEPVYPRSDPSQFLVSAAEMLYVGFDENGMAYVPAIVNCTFNQSVGANGEGGLVRLQVANRPSHWGPSYNVEDVLQEKQGEVDKIQWTEKPHHEYAFCGPPMYGTINKDWIQQWLAYHHYLCQGHAHFYFYDVGGIDSSAKQTLEPWIRAGLLTIVEAFGGDPYPSWYRNQLLFINDCIHRNRFSARWIFSYDLDELLYIPAPKSLDSLLEEDKDTPWMTFANLPFSTSHCRLEESPEDWKIERLLWHDKQPECMHADEDPWLCIEAPGRRKYVVNPRKVFVSGVHRVALPQEGGINFNGSIARIHHFHGVLSPDVNVCGIPINLTDSAGNQPDALRYDFDDSISLLVPKAREYAGALLRYNNLVKAM